MKKKSGYTMLGAIVFLASMGVMSWGQADTPMVAYRWTSPTTGTAVEHYTGEREIDPLDGPTYTENVPSIPDTFYSFDYEWGATIRFRVAGVDSLDRQGPWSVWSEYWTDQGVPGAPGAPIQYLDMVK
jgi:hypothetical protein